jgi:glycerophosphoryl diester phosphodiesterase
MPHPYFDAPRPAVFGHRGASGELPENTLAAFERALAHGADYLATDLHRPRDGQIVVGHDSDVSRVSDGRGEIEALDWSELGRLDAGHGFSPDGGVSFPERGKGHRMPLLDEVFATFPEARLNVELKSNHPALAGEVLDLIGAHQREDRTLLAAAEDDTMALLRDALGKSSTRPAVGASVGDILGFVRSALDGTAPPAHAFASMALQVPPSFANQPLVTAEFVQHAQAHGLFVHVWTINDEAEMARLLELDVDAVMSDFPGRLRAVTDRHLAKSP